MAKGLGMSQVNFPEKSVAETVTEQRLSTVSMIQKQVVLEFVDTPSSYLSVSLFPLSASNRTLLLLPMSNAPSHHPFVAGTPVSSLEKG